MSIWNKIFGFETEYSLSKLKDLDVKRLVDAHKKFQIAVIDDMNFPYTAILKKRGYWLDFRGNLDNVENLSTYPIVVCDIQGVATSVFPEGQGLQLCKEIRKKFINKYIIIYSSSSIPIENANFAFYVDRVVPKDASIDYWDNVLSKGIDEVSSPYKTWIKIRNYLSREEISTKQILRCEEKYIKYFVENKENIDPTDVIKMVKTIGSALEGVQTIGQFLQ